MRELEPSIKGSRAGREKFVRREFQSTGQTLLPTSSPRPAWKELVACQDQARGPISTTQRSPPIAGKRQVPTSRLVLRRVLAGDGQEKSAPRRWAAPRGCECTRPGRGRERKLQ